MTLNNFLKTSVFTLFSIMIISRCSSNNSKSTIKDAPKWFKKVPSKDSFIIVTATGQSGSYQQSINKATLEAKSRLGDMVRSSVQANINSVFEENAGTATSGPGYLDVFSSTVESTFSTLLENWKVTEQVVISEKLPNGNDGFRAYVLLEWDEGKAQQKALAKIKAKKEIYDAVKATDMIKEMEDKVDAYCERYGCD